MYKPYGSGFGGSQVRFGGPLTPTVKVLLISNVVVFLFTFLPSFSNSGAQAVIFIRSYLGMTPSIFWSQFTLWMPFTYLFLHAGFMHILFNMFALWMFGGDVEQVMGTRRFITYYFICGVGAGLLVATLQPGMTIPTIGASGAIYGVILAYGLFFPNRVLYINLIFPIKAKYFVLIIGVMVFLSSLSNAGGGISHIAHLGGLVFGLFYLKWNKIINFFRRFGRKRRSHLHSVDMDRIKRLLEDDDDDNYKIH